MARFVASLDATELAEIQAGRHFAVAKRLSAGGRHADAGWVLEQIWAFAEATASYLASARYADAVRTAVESGDGALFDRTVAETLRVATASVRREAADLLRQRGRHLESSRLIASLDIVPVAQAEALAAAGDRRAAAELLLTAGNPHGALEILRLESAGGSAAERALAAQIAWDLGDTEGTARNAQAALRQGLDEDDAVGVSTLLARALSTLGYDLAAQLVLGSDAAPDRELPPARGRYLVTASMPTQLSGATYVGVDRVTLDEVEIHLLLKACSPEEARAPELLEAIERFFYAATAATALDHPAIRPVLRTDLDQALLVLPRAAGPTLHHQLHPPRPPQPSVRARNLVAFLLQGLVAAHARGLVHGQILPIHIVTDALGRPLLGPFGAYHLAGLTATQTAGLAEVLAFTAPERRRGTNPTTASDVYAIGAIHRALLAGNVSGQWSEPPPGVSEQELALISAMTTSDPERRPSAREVVENLGLGIADVTALYDRIGAAPLPEAQARSGPTDLVAALKLVVDRSWSTDDLDAVAAARCPWLQTILDRDGYVVHLAAWPQGCRRLGPDAPWRELASTALAALPESVRARIEPRLAAETFVVTPADDCVIALDVLLTRAS